MQTLIRVRTDKLRMGDVTESLICIDKKCLYLIYTHFILVDIGDVAKSCDIITAHYVLLGLMLSCEHQPVRVTMALPEEIEIEDTSTTLNHFFVAFKVPSGNPKL